MAICLGLRVEDDNAGHQRKSEEGCERQLLRGERHCDGVCESRPVNERCSAYKEISCLLRVLKSHGACGLEKIEREEGNVNVNVCYVF